MKRYKFFITDGSKRITESGAYRVTKDLPAEFTLEQLQKTSPHLVTASKTKRLEKAKVGTLIVIHKVYGWSSVTGTAGYLAIKCIGEGTLAIDAKREEQLKIETRLKEIDAEIYKIANSLVVEKNNLQHQLRYLKEEIKKFDRGE